MNNCEIRTAITTMKKVIASKPKKRKYRKDLLKIVKAIEKAFIDDPEFVQVFSVDFS